MKLIKISSTEETDTFIVVNSEDLQDCMFAIERFYYERKTPKMRGDSPISDNKLLFDVYGTTSFNGYGSNYNDILFTAEIVQFRIYTPIDCSPT